MSEVHRTTEATTKIRDFPGETPLQTLAKQGGYQTTAMRSVERFPYYTTFPFSWYRACDTTDLEPGAVKPLRLLARDLVIWRDEQGTPHVMDAYCPHLGANLALGGRVAGCNLVCPFHWWEYDGDGRNVHIPYSDRTNAKGAGPLLPRRRRQRLVDVLVPPRPAAGAAVADPRARRVHDRRVDGADRRRMERALPVAGARRERPRLRAPEDGARRRDRARGGEHHLRRMVQPHPRPRRLRDAARPAARPDRHRQLGTRLLGRAVQRDHRHRLPRDDDADRLGVDAVDQELPGQEARRRRGRGNGRSASARRSCATSKSKWPRTT